MPLQNIKQNTEIQDRSSNKIILNNAENFKAAAMKVFSFSLGWI